MLHQPNEILEDKYRIERFLGAGAFAEVYLATHLKLSAPRALKVLSRANPSIGSVEYEEFAGRFSLEARLGAQLDHPNVVRVYDFDEMGSELVLAMEFAPGGSLEDRLIALHNEGKTMSVEETLRIGQEVAEGLGVIHAKGVVHRDLKPANILFGQDGMAKIGDLGLAQVTGFTSQRSLLSSQAKHHPGTPAYMSPEQENTFGMLKSPSDVYSLGIILFEMLTGQNYKMLEPGTRLLDLREDAPDWLDGLLSRMLAEAVSQRPWSGAKVAQTLKQKGVPESPTEHTQRIPGTRTMREANEKSQKGEEPKQETSLQENGQKDLKETEERIRREVQIRMRVEAEEKARLEIEARARQETEEKARKEEEERKREAEERARHEAQERVRREEAEKKAQQDITRRRNIPGFVSRTGDRMHILLGEGIEMELVRVPSGEFLMGSNKQKDEYAQDNECPQHKVLLSEYWMGRTPVTVAQFEIFTRATKYSSKAESNPIKANHPVTEVNWKDATAYCQWLTKLVAENEKGGPASGLKISLPTEAQWEKAARGADGRIYPWGNQRPDKHLCKFGGVFGGTDPVGQYSPQGDSPYGCVDMAGNVWELCQDWFDAAYYQKSPDENPTGPSQGDYHVLRGGSWSLDSMLLRSALRNWYAPVYWINYIGFRCAVLP